MIHIYRCQIELQDSLYFATRELGRLYETEPVLHNYALTYALGLVDNETYGTTVSKEESYRYFCPEQVPKYQEHLTPLNEQGIYVTPAYPVSHATVLNTWKYADNRYHVEMQKTQKNIPSYGRSKEITPESVFECYIVSEQSLKQETTSQKWQWRLPKFIRLGKWMSKAELFLEELTIAKKYSNATFTYPHPLNPLDVMFSNQVISYDVINMPPVSLIHNVHLRGDYYTFTNDSSLKLPVNLTYNFE